MCARVLWIWFIYLFIGMSAKTVLISKKELNKTTSSRNNEWLWLFSDHTYDSYYSIRENSTQESYNIDDNESWEVDDEAIE